MSLIFVLDTSAIIGGFRPDPEDIGYTVSAVISEVKDRDSRLLLELELMENVKIGEPSSYSIKTVTERSKETGDFMHLSPTDLMIVSLAHDFKIKGDDPIIVTDDYDIQNLSRDLSIIFKSLQTRGIRESFIWRIVCKACHKMYDSDYEKTTCECCGSELSKIVTSKEHLEE